MGALYHLKQKLVDFANVVQQNLNRSDTVPSSKVLYDETNEIKESISTVGTVRGLQIEGAGNFSTISVMATQHDRWIDIMGYCANTAQVSAGVAICNIVGASSSSLLFGNSNTLWCQCDDGSNKHYIGVRQNGNKILLSSNGLATPANNYLRFSGRILLSE